MTSFEVADGSSVELGALLAKAGEGSIFEVIGRPDVVVKVFHPMLSGLAERLDKVAAMVDCPPAGAVQSDGFVVLTWPQQVLFEAGRPVGYAMPRINTAEAVELHTVSNPFNRANPLAGTPQWTAHADWSHLLNVAANLCLAVEIVHRVDAVIGDFQERNIFVSDTTRVTLVDCDSMQFTDSHGRQYLCGVGRPEFTAPELATLDLRSQARDKPSDLFPLAVHIYQLLMGGNHPFMRGTWTGAGDQPSALSLARAGHWAGGPGSPLTTHPLAPPLSFLPAVIGALFTRAFTDGAVNPSRRPTAAQWRHALLGIATTPCAGGTHKIPTTTQACPWCGIDAERARRKQQKAVSGARGADEQAIYPVGGRGASPTAKASSADVARSFGTSGRSVPVGRPGYTSATGAKRFSRKTLATIVSGIAISVVAIAAFVFGSSNNESPKAPATGPGGQPLATSQVATFVGYKSLGIGMTQAEAVAVMGPATVNQYYNCTVLGENTMNALRVWISNRTGRVTGIETPSGTLTDRGVGDGSTISEIHAAYDGFGYTIDDGYGGGQGSRAINIFDGPNTYENHRMLNFPLEAGRSGPPSVGRARASEGC